MAQRYNSAIMIVKFERTLQRWKENWHMVGTELASLDKQLVPLSYLYLIKGLTT